MLAMTSRPWCCTWLSSGHLAPGSPCRRQKLISQPLPRNALTGSVRRTRFTKLLGCILGGDCHQSPAACPFFRHVGVRSLHVLSIRSDLHEGHITYWGCSIWFLSSDCITVTEGLYTSVQWAAIERPEQLAFVPCQKQYRSERLQDCLLRASRPERCLHLRWRRSRQLFSTRHPSHCGVEPRLEPEDHVCISCQLICAIAFKRADFATV